MEKRTTGSVAEHEDKRILRSGQVYNRNSPVTPRSKGKLKANSEQCKSPSLAALEKSRQRIIQLQKFVTSTPKGQRGEEDAPSSPAWIALEETRKRMDSICHTVQRVRQVVFENHSSRMPVNTEEENNAKITGQESTTNMIDNIMQIVPVFTGEPAHKAEIDLHIFLNIAQAYYKMLTLTDKIIFLSLVRSLKLRGVPYEICCNSSFATFEELQQVLSEHFFPSKDLSELTYEMQPCRQLHGETVRQFGQRIEFKLKKCELFLTQLCKGSSEPVLQEHQRKAIQTSRRGLLSPSLK